uniref:Uncharacterized protein n=1 Tax=Daphnia galeata TaxID=27404 RepID=A0A8J2W3D5_9CRUS|nr:unnamed protein product [Daphnia galeata]
MLEGIKNNSRIESEEGGFEGFPNSQNIDFEFTSTEFDNSDANDSDASDSDAGQPSKVQASENATEDPLQIELTAALENHKNLDNNITETTGRASGYLGQTQNKDGTGLEPAERTMQSNEKETTNNSNDFEQEHAVDAVFILEYVFKYIFLYINTYDYM